MGVRVMVFNATFNNISVIPWRSVLLVQETGVPGENHRPQVTDKCICISDSPNFPREWPSLLKKTLLECFLSGPLQNVCFLCETEI